MQKVTKEDRLKITVQKALEHLQERLNYGQVQVINKLKTLECAVSASSLSNIKNGRSVGFQALNLASKGMSLLMERELDMGFDAEKLDFQERKTAGWEPFIVPEHDAEQEKNETGFKLHPDGRLSLPEKTAFMSTAAKEVIEVGVRLNSFSFYFVSQNEKAYKSHIINLLKRGVNVKGYLLDPESNEARLYFEDRARVQGFEKDSIGEIKKVIERLREVSAEMEALQLKGKFEIFLYKHIPCNLFFAVDGGEKEGAKMIVSPYLYGVRRANCPVFEFSKKDQPQMFRTHWESLQLFVEGAKKL